MTLRAIIIDDEKSGIETLKMLALRYPNLVKVVASTNQPEEGISLISDYKPDLLFLDISMPTMSGFELLEKLEFRDFKLVFTTAHKEYAIEAIRNKAFDYLLKPIHETAFKSCLENLIEERKSNEILVKPDQYVHVEVLVKDGIIFIKQKEIIRLEASGSYTTFYLDDGTKHVASKGLTDFEHKLNPALFYRCQKSHIVNLHKVRKFVNNKGFFALMSDGSLCDVSRNNKDIFLERLKHI